MNNCASCTLLCGVYRVVGGRGGAAVGGSQWSLSLGIVLVDWLQLTHPSPFRMQGACSAVPEGGGGLSPPLSL